MEKSKNQKRDETQNYIEEKVEIFKKISPN